MNKLPEKYDFSEGSTNLYTITKRHDLLAPCLNCGIFVPVVLDGASYFNYFVRGNSVAECFPTLSLDQRELLISGTHPECWDALMGEDK